MEEPPPPPAVTAAGSSGEADTHLPYAEKDAFLWECEHPKPSLLSSILDKVCLKNDSHSLECLPWRSESLSYKNCSENLKCEKESARRSHENLDFVQKPYEPPCLGKSSRITPVKAGGGDEVMPGGLKPLKYSDSVEVLSVIRYNNNNHNSNNNISNNSNSSKHKVDNTTPSPINFDSSSDIDSIYGQQQQQQTETKIELHDNEAVKFGRNTGGGGGGGREISRSLSMSHPPHIDDDDPREPPERATRSDRKFHSLGRSQDKFVSLDGGTTTTTQGSTTDHTDLRRYGSGHTLLERSQPSESCHDLTFRDKPQPAGGVSQQGRQKTTCSRDTQYHPHAPKYSPVPSYQEQPKLSGRKQELIAQLLSPETRDQSRQLEILSQLLQSDLTDVKLAAAAAAAAASEPCQSQPDNAQPGYGGGVQRYQQHQTPEPPSHNTANEKTHSFNQRSDLLRKLDQTKCALLLEQLIEADAARTRAGRLREAPEQAQKTLPRTQAKEMGRPGQAKGQGDLMAQEAWLHEILQRGYRETAASSANYQDLGQTEAAAAAQRLQYEAGQRYSDHLPAGTSRHQPDHRPTRESGSRHHDTSGSRQQDTSGGRQQDTGGRHQDTGGRHQDTGGRHQDTLSRHPDIIHNRPEEGGHRSEEQEYEDSRRLAREKGELQGFP